MGPDDSFPYLRWFAYAVVAPTVTAAGFLGNFLNLIVLKRPELRGVTYVYLTGLAVADLGLMVSLIPTLLRFNNRQSESYPAAFFHAHVELVVTNFFMASSIFIVCFLTVDRYMSVCLITKFKSLHTKKNALLSISASYILGIVVSCPLMALKTVCIPGRGDKYSFEENVKVTNSRPWMGYIVVSEVLVRFGPACILASLNTLIIRKFGKLGANRKRFRNKDSENVRGRNYQDEKRLVRLLTYIIVTFFLTMTPSAFLSLLYSETRDKEFGFQAFRAVANNLEMGNFALNFYIYFLCSKEFRRTFHLVMSECFCSRLKLSQTRREDLTPLGTTVRPSPKLNEDALSNEK